MEHTTQRDEWVTIPCHTLNQAVARAIATTENYFVSFSGDFGQDEDAGEVGMGNADYSIIVWPNGSAMLTVRDDDNAKYLADCARKNGFA